MFYAFNRLIEQLNQHPHDFLEKVLDGHDHVIQKRNHVIMLI